RIAEGVNVEEAEHREQGADKEQRSGERSTMVAGTCQPDERGEEREQSERKEPLPPDGGVDRPVRIHEDEVDGPDKFGRIEPGDAPGEQEAVEERQFERSTVGSDVRALHPGGEETGGGGDCEPGHEGLDILFHAKFAALPPEDHQEGGGQGGGDGFRHQSEEEEAEGEEVIPAAARLIESEVNECRGEAKDAGEGALLFGDPGYRFDGDRVESEEEAGQPGA